MILDFILGKKYSMPTVEEINLSASKSLDEEAKKNKTDCTYMYNLLNKCLTKAVNSKNDYTSVDFDKYILNYTYNTNITKCDDFNDYNKELHSRGIKLKHYDSYRHNNIKYDSKDKILTIYG